ncbi:hypothetical protein AAVH_12560 [Aphelenchoides avenae]|nr:hypothetical protein AAVH_12560 [Aphelenchus avenae]
MDNVMFNDDSTEMKDKNHPTMSQAQARRAYEQLQPEDTEPRGRHGEDQLGDPLNVHDQFGAVSKDQVSMGTDNRPAFHTAGHGFPKA